MTATVIDIVVLLYFCKCVCEFVTSHQNFITLSVTILKTETLMLPNPLRLLLNSGMSFDCSIVQLIANMREQSVNSLHKAEKNQLFSRFTTFDIFQSADFVKLSLLELRSTGIFKLGGAPPLGDVKASQGGREHDSDILMKSSSELQSNIVTTSLLIYYIGICDLVLKTILSGL